MATDSVLEFKFSDGVGLCGLYIRSDTHHQEFIPELKRIFSDADSDIHKGRLNWDYLVTKVVGSLILTDRSVKLLTEDCRNTDLVVYHTVITPQISTDYGDTENSIENVIHVKTKSGNGETVYFDGLLGDCDQLELIGDRN